jgi:hypothetical protein
MSAPPKKPTERAAASNGLIEGYEKSILAYLMSEPRACDQFLHRVSPDILYCPHHRTIIDAIRDLSDERRKVNLVTVSNRLSREHKLAECGGRSGIAAISIETTSEEIAESALDCILDDYRERKGAHICKQLAAGDITLNEAVEGLEDLNKPRNGQLPPIVDAAQLIANPIVLPDDVIKDILHRGGKALFAGATKSYKTWMFIDLAVSVATGTDWLDKFATKRGRVLYINLEIQSGFFAKRIQTICDERHLKLESGYLTVWNLRGYAADLSTLLPRLLRGIGQDEYVLIILDPIYKLLGKREENAAGDIASLLNEIESLAVETRAAVAFGAHYSKGNQAGKESIDRVSGSGVFSRDPDTLLNFTKHEEDDAFTVEATLRNHAPAQPFVVRWEFPLFVVASELDPAQLKKAGAAVKRYRSEVLTKLLTHPMTTTEFRKMADEECGMSKSTFFRLFDELKEDGIIISSPDRKWKRT